MPLTLRADSPREFVATHLRAHLDRHADPGNDRRDGWLRLSDLMVDDVRRARSMFGRLVADGTPPQAAATYLAGWIAGALADVVGFVYATTGAGIIADPASVAWHQHRDGWMDSVDVTACEMAVPAGHPWSGLDGTVTVADDREVVHATIAALVATVTPLIDGCHQLTRVGMAGLWNEVADGLGMAITFQPELPIDRRAVDALDRLVNAKGVPWRSRPRVDIHHTPIGDAYLGQKGGCCLAYTAPPHEFDQDDMEPETRDYYARFPLEPAGQRYCSTCSLRSPSDCRERQIFWHEQQAEHHLPPSTEGPTP